MTNCGSEGCKGLIFPVCPLLLILLKPAVLRIIHRALGAGKRSSRHNTHYINPIQDGGHRHSLDTS